MERLKIEGQNEPEVGSDTHDDQEFKIIWLVTYI